MTTKRKDSVYQIACRKNARREKRSRGGDRRCASMLTVVLSLCVFTFHYLPAGEDVQLCVCPCVCENSLVLRRFPVNQEFVWSPVLWRHKVSRVNAAVWDRHQATNNLTYEDVKPKAWCLSGSAHSHTHTLTLVSMNWSWCGFPPPLGVVLSSRWDLGNRTRVPNKTSSLERRSPRELLSLHHF